MHFIESLNSIPEETRVVVADELKQMMLEMDEADVNIRSKIKVAAILSDARVHPAIIRELGVLASLMKKEQVHVMDSPESIITISKRQADWSQGKVTLNEILTDRLVGMRAKRTNKSLEEAK